MADVKWIKIVTDIFDDEKMLLIESAPDADAIIVIWFKLLCLAGKQNNGGIFMLNDKIAFTDEMLATIFRRQINTVRLALNMFERFGMIEVIDNVISIPNWEKHQSLDALEAKKLRDRAYQAKKRAEVKQLVQNNRLMSDELSSDNRLIEEDKNKIRIDKNKIEEDFELFWQAYPKKKSKGEAYKAFKKIKNVNVQTMINAVEEQKNTSQWKKDDGQFIPYPATWLNQQRWEDEVDNVIKNSSPIEEPQLPISIRR